MSTITDKYIFEALNNNTFNLKILDETLWEIKERSFRTLYNIQRSVADITRIDIDMSEYIIKTFSKYVYNVNHDLIGVNRDIYRKSEFYKKDITLSDIMSNPKIFSNIPLLFINGDLYTNYTLSILDGGITINFNLSSKTGEMSTSYFTNLVYQGKNIKKFSTTNTYTVGEYVEYTYANGIRRILECVTDSVTGEFNEHDWKIATSTGKMTLMIVPTCATLYDNTYNHYILRDIVNDGLKFINGSVNYENSISPTPGGFVFVTPDPAYKFKYQLLDGELTEHDGVEDYRFKYSLSKQQINSILDGKFTSPRPCDIRLMHMKNYIDRIVLGSDQEYFELPIYDCPVPIENMFIFGVLDSTGEVFFDHDATITQYYPNVYSIQRTGSYTSIIYVMYADISASINFGYHNELKIYYNNTKNILDKYKNNTIPEKIKTYKHIDITYDINDYSKSVYAPDHLEYKISKFKSLVSKNGEFYRWYLKRLNMKKNKFSIDVSDINLSNRIRVDNTGEVSDISSQTTFDEERYLIVIKPGCGSDIGVFIDNKLYTPDNMYTVDEDIILYIPTDKLNSDSVISIETLENINMREKLVFGDDYIHINIPQNLNISSNDIYLSIITDDGEKYLYNKPDEDKIFNMYVKDDDGNYVEIDPSAFYTHKDIYIELLDESLKDSEIFLNVDKLGFTYSQSGNPTFILPLKINNDPRNIHIYKNGLRVPDNSVVIEFSEFVNGPHTVKSNLVNNDDDIFTIIVNHDKYTTVAELNTIPNTGLIDLTGLIDKPFDLDWHDIYINGLKLTEHNIEYISPYTIMVTDINTLKNVVVYEKNLDSGILSPDAIDDVSSFQNKLVTIEPDEPIVDELPDILDDIILDYIGFIDKYLIDIELINPDEQQITDEMIAEYDSLMDEDHNMYLNPDSGIKNTEDILINPDEEYSTNTL